MAATLTVANSTMVLTTETLFPSGNRIQGYAADDAFDPEAIENGEFSMGIDGTLSAGFVFNEVPFSITLQADSPSLTIFEQIWLYEYTNRTKLLQNLTITIPASNKRYDLVRGYMKSYKAPGGKKILQPGVVQFIYNLFQFSPL